MFSKRPFQRVDLRLAVVTLALCCVWPSSARLTARGESKKAEMLVFWENDGDDLRLTALNPLDKMSRRLTSPPAPDQMQAYWPALLSPDGKRAAYPGTKFDDNAEGEGMVHLRSLDKPEAVGRSLGVKGDPVCWSPDGKQLIVADLDDAAFPQTIIDVSTGGRTALHVSAIKPAREDGAARVQFVTDWSRDGKWLVACFNPKDEEGLQKGDLYLTKSDGSEPQHLKHLGHGLLARFSPDGARILYLRHADGNAPRLCVAGVKPGKPAPVSQAMNGSIDENDFCWSPDGTRVAYLWQNGQKGADAETFLMVVDADGGNEQVLTSVKGEGHELKSLNWR